MKKSGHKLQEIIRIEAYLLSEKAGHPSGMDDVFWAQAETLVLERAGKGKKSKTAPAAAKSAKAVKTGKRKKKVTQ